MEFLCVSSLKYLIISRIVQIAPVYTHKQF